VAYIQSNSNHVDYLLTYSLVEWVKTVLWSSRVLIEVVDTCE